ncbi:MAG TPA: ATP-binding protein [Longimicrobiales bacterium]|nr:ATP-binding protein [Longimicrobiales bacterium]
MDPSDLAARLAALKTFSTIPRDELEWLARHGECTRYDAGAFVVRKGGAIEHLWIVLSGNVSVHRNTAAGRRRVMSWAPGDVTGRLPYSRMKGSTVDIRLEEPMEVFMLHEAHFPELAARCPAFMEHTVHLMLDRARQFKATELQAEKLVSLGRLSAGLAHELNNPASATVRGAALLRQGLAETERSARELFASDLPPETLALLEEARTVCVDGPAGVLSALEQADREADVEDWLEDHGCDPAHAGPVAETPVTLETLDRIAEALSGPPLDAALRWLAASCTTSSIAADVESAARRIHELVAAVKRFTYMDNLTSAETASVEEGLRDTVTVLGAKARGKGAAVRMNLDADLPPVRASGSEVNQVWMNLIDNALDAIGESGTVEITARLDAGRVVVRIVDDGPGIPDEVIDRIFDPFFTTKGPGGGTGLGLDIARRIVVQSGGELDVATRPGRTEFRVTLMAAD